MEGDCSRVMVDLENGPVSPTVTLVREKSTGRWRLCGALLAMALCVSAALFFTCHSKKQDHTEKDDEIHHNLRQLSGNRKAAIHLEGEYNTNGDYKSSVEWTDDEGQGFSQGGLKLNNNEIVIPQTGLYFIYSQVSFHVSCKADPKHPNNQDMVHLSNTVTRWSPSYGTEDNKEYQTLLNSVRTVCKKSSDSEASEGKWYNAVYMGAVFSLEKGDRLRTVTENRLLPHLESGAGKNFFGVFAL
ncbi:tumor necrosis factor [Oncorhynchus keta]|uniref:tumor necrosis factor n=1 Tax=Oncorhynchus keta TaxID=8018 RepID=UPI00227A5CD3|nr:tumor necrosis factor [Oncorhynchus keta]